MSRIGKQPVTLSGTTLEVTGNTVLIRGSKGELKVTLPEGLNLVVENGIAIVTRNGDEFSAAHGLFRSLLFNAVKGVSEGWQRTLEINGVGMKAALTGGSITLNLGFSHPIVFDIPEGIQAPGEFPQKENSGAFRPDAPDLPQHRTHLQQRPGPHG